MARQPLAGRRIAVLATDGFEQAELEEPVQALKAAGAEVEVVSPQAGEIQGMELDQKGHRVPVDRALDEADPGDYDGLVLPGGTTSPDRLRLNPKAVRFVKGFAEAQKPIAAICHGPSTLINAEAVEGRRLTSGPSLEMALTKAGAQWVDEEVVVDEGLVTSRRPDDLPAFCAQMITTFAESRYPWA